MDFPGNTFSGPGQLHVVLRVLEQKIHGENFRVVLKTAKVYPSQTLIIYGT